MDIITDSFDKMSVNQIYSQLSSKYAQLNKVEKAEQVEWSATARQWKPIWQPIETAPKNVNYLIRATHDSTGAVVHVAGRFKEDGFYCEDGGELSFNYTPTHWTAITEPTEHS